MTQTSCSVRSRNAVMKACLAACGAKHCRPDAFSVMFNIIVVGSEVQAILTNRYYNDRKSQYAMLLQAAKM